MAVLAAALLAVSGAGTAACSERASGATAAQDVRAHLETFPASPPTASPEPQTYRLDYRLHNRDITGATMSSTLVLADYTRAPGADRFTWNNVSVATASGEAPPEPPGQSLDIMEDFSYGLSEEIIREPMYDRFPSGDLRDLVKTMVWDGMLIEMFDMLLPGFGELTLNEFHEASEYQNVEIEMGDWGSLLMRDLQLKWSGMSEVNGEPCAIVLFQSFSNPVDAAGIRGRSCYWGQVWISAEDSQIECLTMNEDVILEIPTGEDASTVLNLQRQVRFDRTA